MATADGFVHPAVPSLDNVVRPGRGGMDVPHDWYKRNQTVRVQLRLCGPRKECVTQICVRFKNAIRP